AITDHQIGSALDELPILANPAFALQVESHPHVNTAVSKMTVERRVVIVFIEQLADIAQVTSQFFRRYSRVVPSFPFRWSTRRGGGRTRSRLAHLPYQGGFTLVVEARFGRAGPSSQPVDHLAGELVCLIWVAGPKFHQQDASSRRKKVQVGSSLLLQTIDDTSFQTFQSDWPEGQDLRNMIRRQENIFISKSNECSVPWTLDQIQLGVENDSARALRPDQ